MRILLRFLERPFAQNKLLIQTSFLLVLCRALLHTAPFHWLLKQSANAGATPAQRATREEILWAVEAAAFHLRFMVNCLSKALVAQFLLRRAGIPAQLRLGAARNQLKPFEAHAWIEVDGVTVVGGERTGFSGFPLPEVKKNLEGSR